MITVGDFDLLELALFDRFWALGDFEFFDSSSTIFLSISAYLAAYRALGVFDGLTVVFWEEEAVIYEETVSWLALIYLAGDFAFQTGVFYFWVAWAFLAGDFDFGISERY